MANLFCDSKKKKKKQTTEWITSLLISLTLLSNNILDCFFHKQEFSRIVPYDFHFVLYGATDIIPNPESHEPGMEMINSCK